MTPLNKPLRRETTGKLTARFLADRDRPLVVTLLPGDRIQLRPKGRRSGEVVLDLADIYGYGLRIQAAARQLVRARSAKARRAQRLANQRQQRAERRLTQ